jgi:hypothetical protein
VLPVGTVFGSNQKMDEESIKIQMRLYCVEWLCASTTAAILKSTGRGEEVFSEMRTHAVAGARHQSFSDDPAMSDYLSAELESALDRLLGMTRFFLGKN